MASEKQVSVCVGNSAFFVADDTLTVHELPKRNGGFKGGEFTIFRARNLILKVLM
jgi:hypothetical protein